MCCRSTPSWRGPPASRLTTVEFPRTECTTINNVSAKVKLITVVITPSGNDLMHPVTTQFRRTISGNGNPLKTQ